MLERLRGVAATLNAQPAAVKVVLIVVALVLAVLLSRVAVVFAVLLFIVSLFVLLIRLLRRRPLKTWGIIALASLVALIVFTGVSNAVYGPPEQPAKKEQAVAPESTSKEPDPTREETAKEESTQPAETTTKPETQPEETTDPTTQAQSSTPSTSACSSSDQTLSGVYHPERLKILDPCLEASGTVAKVLHEKDGDLHIRLTLDEQYGSLLSVGNNTKQHGDLVVEYMARDAGHLTEPKTGDHLDVVGAWVNDDEHNWNEIHPVFSASLNGGPGESSGSQFGGNATSDRSSNAAAGCRTETAQACTGYGPRTDSSDEPSDSEADENVPSQPSPQPPPPQPQEQPTPTPTPDVPSTPATPTPPKGSGKGGRLTCADFSTQAQAQAALPANPQLDGNDNDGKACESLP